MGANKEKCLAKPVSTNSCRFFSEIFGLFLKADFFFCALLFPVPAFAPGSDVERVLHLRVLERYMGPFPALYSSHLRS